MKTSTRVAMPRPSGSKPRLKNWGLLTNNQMDEGISWLCLLWGGLDKSRHIVPTALLVRVLLLLNWLFNVTINDISVISVTAHRWEGGLKKKFDLRPGSQRHRHFVGFFKANMNSYILLQTAAIFFLSSLYLKQGIDSVYVMVGFICKG